MSKVRLTGATSGYTEIAAPATAGNNTITLPSGSGTAGQVLQTNGSGTLSFAHGAASGPVFSVLSTNVQTVTNNTDTKVQLTTEEYDIGNYFDSASNYRFLPAVAGYYQINFGVYGKGSTGTNLVVATITKNGVSLGTNNNSLWGSYVYNAATVYTDSVARGSVLVYMNGSSDYIELFGRVVGSGTITLNAGNLQGFLARPA